MIPPPRARGAAVVLLALLVLAACTAQNAAPVIKLGVIAPFEGAGRPLGYAVLPEIKQAIADANASGAFGPYRVAVVAFNDNLDGAAAAEQARALALDPDVMAVLGVFTPETAAAAGPVLDEGRVPFAEFTAMEPTAKDHAGDVDQARKAAAALIEALAADIATNGEPSRAGVREALGR